jgi:hypothetical protein
MAFSRMMGGPGPDFGTWESTISFHAIAPCPTHFTFFVKWVGNHEFSPAETVKLL